jgi:hypothetical protein
MAEARPQASTNNGPDHGFGDHRLRPTLPPGESVVLTRRMPGIRLVNRSQHLLDRAVAATNPDITIAFHWGPL